MHNFSTVQNTPQARGGSLRLLMIVVIVALVTLAGIAVWRGVGNASPAAEESVQRGETGAVVAGFEIVESNGSQMTVRDADGDSWVCEGLVSVEACEIQPNEGSALYEPLGWPTRAGALANCPSGTVGEVWRKGSVAGWACEWKPIVE